mmetsp:Transcript_18017/g.31530  ORF Transcript_18017/g.31530 Transcript_18017/m.31530 type:complete len:265 (-) Transcript_18017:37-831(-)
MNVEKLFNVESKIVVVTGGLTGIGEMMSKGFLANGATVIVSSRKATQKQADALAAQFQNAKCFAISADLSSEDGCLHLKNEIKKITKKVHVLINNSGCTWGETFDDYPEQAWDKIYNLNVKSIFSLTRALKPLLLEASKNGEPSRVINIGSIDGIRITDVEHYAYSASKSAVHMLTRVLASQLAPNITVNALACGYFRTKMTAGLEKIVGKDYIENMAPLKRSGSAEDAAGAALWLSSRAGAWVTGAIVPLDGGVLVHPHAAKL